MYYIYDRKGCAYAQDIVFAKEKMTTNRWHFIDEVSTWEEAKKKAGRYLYDIERQIEYSYDREYWERVGYPEFDPDEWDDYWGNEEDHFITPDDDEEDW